MHKSLILLPLLLLAACSSPGNPPAQSQPLPKPPLACTQIGGYSGLNLVVTGLEQRPLPETGDTPLEEVPALVTLTQEGTSEAIVLTPTFTGPTKVEEGTTSQILTHYSGEWRGFLQVDTLEAGKPVEVRLTFQGKQPQPGGAFIVAPGATHEATVTVTPQVVHPNGEGCPPALVQGEASFPASSFQVR